MHTDMKLKLFSWFLFFLLFSEIVSRSACHTAFSLTHAGSELSEYSRGKQPEGSNAVIGMDIKRTERGSEVEKFVHQKGQKGTGGAADIRRRPPRTSHHSGASTLHASPYVVMDVVKQFSIGLMLVLHFFF